MIDNCRWKYVLVFGVVACGIAAVYWPTPRRQAMARIEALNGTYFEQQDDEDVPHRINGVMLAARPVTEADLAALRDLRPLHRIILDGSNVTDAGLAHLEELEELELVSLINTQITDSGLAHLKGLKHLRILTLRRTKVTDAGMAHLQELTGLRSLNVAETLVTDPGVETLKRHLPGLRNVYLHVERDD